MTAVESQIVQWHPKHGPVRRIEFEPYGDGRYLRKEREWAGCRWRTIGTEVVDRLCIDPADEGDTSAGESYCGP